MNKKTRQLLAASAGLVALLGIVWAASRHAADSPASTPALTVERPTSSPEVISDKNSLYADNGASSPAASKTLSDLVRAYGGLGLTDIHNHDASDSKYARMRGTWNRNAVSRVILFGDISEPSAVVSDVIAWAAYQDDPERIVPFFTGIDLHDPAGIAIAKANFEKGYFGLGEIAAASTYSPVVSKVAWKANDPMDGILPQLYELCGQYKAPVLLHIDPPSGLPVDKLEEALDKYPQTNFIFGHINAFNPPGAVQDLMSRHSNLYADFFAGFTAFDPQSANTLDDFVPVIKQFPDRFMLSTDSGFGLESEEKAIEAMYQLLDKLQDRELARRIAHDNADALIGRQPATAEQKANLAKLPAERLGGKQPETMTKLEAGRILAEALR